ncbi:hypothetical protein LWC34_35385 [Kibdelosporangium philippinense]|uniref:ATP synthase protein I n=1 Tax=Kibdelosporangium philippinense TaxID=211113 RepID=A0ABS8ZJV5_9PSEU|nr:hypothetical protein [Kibdelosporangium philippinense]MCE7008069.1 hypothetical protein [Kibdelosporangium philippinense]
MSENFEIPKQPETHEEVIRALAKTVFWAAVSSTVITVVIAAVLAGVLVGSNGVYGALAGGAVGLLSAVTTSLLMRQTAGMAPQKVLFVVLGGFAGKMIILLIAMMVLGTIAALHRNSLAFTLLATILVSATAEVFAFRRTKVPTIIPASKEG